MASKIERYSMLAILVGLLGIIGFGVYYQYRSNVQESLERLAMERRRELLIDICHKEGMEAVDYDYPHSPKCYDMKSGLMYLPLVLYYNRGGHL